MNADMLKLLEGDLDSYPTVLETRFRRVFDRILALWGTNEFDPYINSLFINDSGSRQGFPDDAMSEIFRLSRLHDAAMQRAQEARLWELEAAKRGIAEMNVEFSAQGLSVAIEAGRDEAVALFVQAGFDLEIRNAQGWTPLMIAAFFGHEKAAATLVQAGADVHARDGYGYSPIHWAALQGFDAVVDLLLTKGAGANDQSLHGITPLLQAAAAGHARTVRLLLERRAQPSLPDNEGWTPLHKAVANGHLAVILELLDHGADPEAAHASGLTPVEIARQKHRDHLVAVLTRRG